MFQHKPVRHSRTKLHQLRFPTLFNRNIRNDVQHFVLVIHLKRIERLYQPVPVFTAEDDVILVAREVVAGSQIITQCHGTTFGQTSVRFQRSFGRSIADDIQTLHLHVGIRLQIVNHRTYLRQFLRIVHIFGTDIHLIHLEIQKTFRLHITAFYLLHRRLYVREIGSHHIRNQHTFERNLIKSVLHIHQCAFATTALITLHVQTGIRHPSFVRQRISVADNTTLLLLIFLYQIRCLVALLRLSAHHRQPAFINQILVFPLDGNPRKIVGNGGRNQLRDKVHPMR